MADVRLMLQYENYEVSTNLSLQVDIPEILRRVRLKRSPYPLHEMAHQVAYEIQCAVEEQHVIRDLVHELVERIGSE